MTESVETFFRELDNNSCSGLGRLICLYRLAGIIGKQLLLTALKGGIILILPMPSATEARTVKLALSMCTYVFEHINRSANKSLILLESEIMDYIKANCCKKTSVYKAYLKILDSCHNCKQAD